MKTNINIKQNQNKGLIIRQILLCILAFSITFFISCNSTNQKSSARTNTYYDENGQLIIEISSSELGPAIDAYNDTIKVIYKVNGNMTNEDFQRIVNKINNKRREWSWQSYIGLDLSKVKGLTRISDTWDLTTLTIPVSVFEFGDNSTLENVIISKNNTNFVFDNGILYSKDKSILYLYSRKSESTFTVPDTVKKIWAYSFSNNPDIKNIKIPESVVYIGTDAFRNPQIESISYEDKKNWTAHKNFYNTDIEISGDDLENVQNYLINQITFDSELLQNSYLFKSEHKGVSNNLADQNALYKTDNQENSSNTKEDNTVSFIPMEPVADDEISLPHEATNGWISAKSIDDGVIITIDYTEHPRGQDMDGWLVENNSGIRVQFLKKDIVSFIYPFTEPGIPADFWLIGADSSVKIMPTGGIGNPMKKAFNEIKIDSNFNSKKKKFYGSIETTAQSANDFFDTDYAIKNKYLVYLECYVRVVNTYSTAAAYSAIGFKEPKGLFPDWFNNRKGYYSFETMNKNNFETDFYNSLNLKEFDSFYTEIQARYEDEQRTNFYISGPQSNKKPLR